MSESAELSGQPDYQEEVWQDLANCIGVDPDLFMEVDPELNDLAKKVCAGCPVMYDCFQYAIQYNEKHGVWGGLTAEERQRVVDFRSIMLGIDYVDPEQVLAGCTDAEAEEIRLHIRRSSRAWN